jgi:5-methylcytosine-specific restriction protein B
LKLNKNKFKIFLEQINYYVVGANWEGEDQTTSFVENSTWQNGYDGKFTEETNAIQAGSRIAIKAVHTVEKIRSVMTIKAIGTVTVNQGDGRNLDVEWEKDFKRFQVDFSGGYWQTVHQVKNEDHIKAIFFRREPEAIQKSETMPNLNIILYGPPGTGKTYNSIDKAVEIIMGKSLGNHNANKLEFDRLRKEGQIEFVTFHQNYSYEDFMVGITPDVTAGNLRFDKKEGIFKILNDRAKNNWLASINPNERRIDFEHVFNSFFSKLIEEEVEHVEIPMKSKGYSFRITKVDLDEGRIKFTKHSGGTGHDLLITNIKGIYEGTLDYALEGLGVYYYPLDDKLKEYAIANATNTNEKVNLKKYVLVIDEINRANISKVFGEIITLLEEDKRLGEVNELKVTLPNGEKDFGIPPNLYIIGTMNTADRSIALIDIALRRRFEFIGKYPTYENLEGNEATLLQKINEAIYEEKKSADYLIGHAYFMKKQSIEDILKSKVIPLLMEYFAGRTETVSKMFNNTDWKVDYDKICYSWNIKQND